MTTSPSSSPTPPSATTGAPAGPRPLLVVLGRAGATVLGAVLLVAAWAKMIHPVGFADQIEAQGLAWPLGAEATAFFALGLELALGMLLLLWVRRLWVLVPSALLVAFFLFLTGREYGRSLMGIEPDAAACGCFGNLVERTPAEAFWQDLFLLVPALVLAFLGRHAAARRFPPLRLALAALVTVGGLVLAWRAPELPLDDWATRLKPGVTTAGTCAGEGDERVCLDTIVPEADEGRHLVILAELEDEAFTDRLETVNAYGEAALMDDLPPLWVVTTAESEERQEFFWLWGPTFELRQAPEALLAPLYRRLPRSFLVEDGTVVETYDGLPPFDRWLETASP